MWLSCLFPFSQPKGGSPTKTTHPKGNHPLGVGSRTRRCKWRCPGLRFEVPLRSQCKIWQWRRTNKFRGPVQIVHSLCIPQHLTLRATQQGGGQNLRKAKSRNLGGASPRSAAMSGATPKKAVLGSLVITCQNPQTQEV